MTRDGQTSPVAIPWPRWLLEIRRSLPVRSQLVLSGNIRDVYLTPAASGPALLSIREALWEGLADRGFEFFVVYDPIDGLGVYPDDPQRREAGALLLAGGSGGPSATEPLRRNGRLELMLPRLSEYLRLIALAKGHRVAAVIDYASRLVPDHQHFSTEEFQFFAACEKLAYGAQPILIAGNDAGPLFNPLIWLVTSDIDLPHWLLTGNERIRAHAVPKPDFENRLAAARKLARAFPGFADCAQERVETFIQAFADQTEGLPLTAMIAITQLARGEGLRFEEVEEAVLRYKVGVSDNPWKKPHLQERVRDAEEEIVKRVKGQRPAIRKTLDILKRSITGLTGAHTSRRSGRPRGVLFFAGPTGVGKTELAKALTESLFGDEQAYIRFDMSEFSAEHSDARLLGSPPGYVGYDTGGELTNALRARPFSVVLFDEIEKAHPRILDKFLQILEDGRLTDGRGNTVYFSEAVIVFTSNLGSVVRRRDDSGLVTVTENVSPGMKYEEVERRIREAIQQHFKFELGRPELLNRIGDNIVVFNFIDPPVANEIFTMMLANVIRRVEQEHGLALDLPEEVTGQLGERCTADLTNGGRGIGNYLESKFVNPLAAALFERAPAKGAKVLVEGIRDEGGVCTVSLR